MNFKKIIFLLLLLGCVAMVPGPADLHKLVSAVKPAFVMVIDAGHGGPDGGAEAADGTKESEINLAIAKALQEKAEKQGITVVMTREEEEGLYEAQNAEMKWKKLGDLKERKRIIDGADADVVVSIHLNSFWSDTDVRGAQVFYPKSCEESLQVESAALADCIQNSLIKGLNDGSNRTEMGKNDIYLFKEITCPTVLVECGFLSNQQDLSNLKNETYQKKVADCILKGVMEISAEGR